MSTPSGTVVQNGLNGGSLLFTDTGSYGTVSSRTLTIYDYLGNPVAPSPFNMGTNLTQLFSFNTDAWFHFQNVVVDGSGTWTTDVYVVADGFYWEAYLNQFVASQCGNVGVNSNLEISQLCLQAALRFNLSGLPGAASTNSAIIAANYFVNQSVLVTYQ